MGSITLARNISRFVVLSFAISTHTYTVIKGVFHFPRCIKYHCKWEIFHIFICFSFVLPKFRDHYISHFISKVQQSSKPKSSLKTKQKTRGLKLVNFMILRVVFVYCSISRPLLSRFVVSVREGYIFYNSAMATQRHLHSINITILCSFVALRHEAGGSRLGRLRSRELQTERYINYSLFRIVNLMALIVDVMEISCLWC